MQPGYKAVVPFSTTCHCPRQRSFGFRCDPIAGSSSRTSRSNPGRIRTCRLSRLTIPRTRRSKAWTAHRQPKIPHASNRFIHACRKDTTLPQCPTSGGWHEGGEPESTSARSPQRLAWSQGNDDRTPNGHDLASIPNSLALRTTYLIRRLMPATSLPEAFLGARHSSISSTARRTSCDWSP